MQMQVSLQTALHEDGEFSPIEFYFFGIIEGEKGNVLRLWDDVRGKTGKRFEDSG